MTSIMVAIAFIVIFYKLGIMRFIRHSSTADATIDTGTTIALAIMFSGSYMGLLTGFFAGLIISAWLTITRLIALPNSKLKSSNWKRLK